MTKIYDVSNVAIYPEVNELNVSTSVIELSVPGRGSKSTILYSCSKLNSESGYFTMVVLLFSFFFFFFAEGGN